MSGGLNNVGLAIFDSERKELPVNNPPPRRRKRRKMPVNEARTLLLGAAVTLSFLAAAAIQEIEFTGRASFGPSWTLLGINFGQTFFVVFGIFVGISCSIIYRITTRGDRYVSAGIADDIDR